MAVGTRSTASPSFPGDDPPFSPFPIEAGDLLAERGGLCAAIPGPFILLKATARQPPPPEVKPILATFTQSPGLVHERQETK